MKKEDIKTKNNNLSIKSIEVIKLFGHYTYKLSKNDLSDSNKLLILYGDNGSGKTTLLKLIFYLLSTQYRAGHKTMIAKIKFKRIDVNFENGTTISAYRDGNEYEGSFKYCISENGKEKFNIPLKTNQEGSIQLSSEKDTALHKEFRSALKYLKALKLSIFFLTDDRQILSSTSNSNNENENENDYNYDYETEIIENQNVFRRHTMLTKELLSGTFVTGEKNKRSAPVVEALDRLTNWIKGRLIVDSNIGEKNTNIIYTDIVRAISKSGDFENKGNTKADKEDFLIKLKNLSDRTEDFSKYGFVPKFDLQEVKNIISLESNTDKISIIINILKPFYQGVEARLNALEQLKGTIEGFLKNINSYFTNKQISYNISKGFILKHNEGETLTVDMLSSGERQFLLLLCNTITATEEATIFIIDEPEISLNVKWQRKLLNTLLQFSRDNQQFIISTHSIELLTNHKNNIVKLQEV